MRSCRLTGRERETAAGTGLAALLLATKPPSVPISDPQPARPARPSGATAGFLLLGTVLLCAGIGAGLGALVGALAPLVVLGTFAGFGAGFALVYSRYRTL
jgi:hypothetical protein